MKIIVRITVNPGAPRGPSSPLRPGTPAGPFISGIDLIKADTVVSEHSHFCKKY